MKKIILILFLGISGNTYAHEWTKSDKWRQGAYTALHVADWLQTRQISKRDEFTERNTILGEHPFTEDVDRYFAVTLIAHYLIADNLPPKYRRAFQYVTIGVQAGAVGHNYSAGVQIRF